MPQVANVKVAGVRVVSVHLQHEGGVTSQTTAATTTKADPSPLQIKPAELFWGLGSFLGLLALMRFVLYPRVAAGTKARSEHIANTLAEADRVRAEARADVVSYETRLAEVRAEAAGKVNDARQQIERERADELAAVGRRISALKADAATQADAARTSVSGSVVDAASDVVVTATRVVLGTVPDSGMVRAAVTTAMGSS